MKAGVTGMVVNSDAFLKVLRNNRLKSYKATPGDIEEHQNAEIRVAGDTAGRPLIELIQNADDAMNQSEDKNRIKIILKNDILFIANDGSPFSPKGVEAICNLDRSPKKDRRITIGNKGIGFKSVLTWTKKPTIYSKTFKFTFDREKAANDISLALNRKYHPEEVPLMRLPYPPSERIEAIDALFHNGFATVIVLELKDKTVSQSILKELKNFDPLTLLFLNSVLNFSIESDEFSRQHKIHRGEGQVDIETNGDCETYKVFSIEQRKIPSEISSALPDDCRDLTHGSVSIAFPETPLTNYSQIFSYFPTRERCPFKFLVHGDFILDAGRKHLREDAVQYNQWVIKELASLFVEKVIPFFGRNSVTLIDFLECRSPEDMEPVEKQVFEKFAQILGKKDFLPVMKNPLRLVAPCSAGLSDKETLTEISVLTNKEVQWEGCYLIEPEWTSGTRLQTLVKLGGKNLTKSDSVQILGSIAKPDPAWCTRALNTVFKWIENAPSWSAEEATKDALQKEKLFLTSKGELRFLTDDNLPPLFLPPNRDVKIPSFIPLDFLNSEVGKGLEGAEQERFKKGLSQLSELGLYPFRPIDIVKKAILPLLEDIHNPINHDPSRKKDLLVFLAQLAPNEKKFQDTEPIPWLDDLRTQLAYKVFVPTESGEWHPAWKVYASKEWGAPEELFEIYKDIKNRKFLASPNSDVHKGISFEKWKSLYRYLGVSWEPKILPIEKQPGFISEHDFPNPHPIHVSKEAWERYKEYCKKNSDLHDMWYGRNSRRMLKESYVIDNWKEIIKDKNRCINLFHLLYKTKMFDYIAGPQKDKIKCKFKYTKISYTYSSSCDSILLWGIKHSNWIPSVGEGFSRPDEVFLEDSEVGRSLKGFVPTLQVKRPKEKEARRRFEDLIDEIGSRTNWDQIKTTDWEKWLRKLSETNSEISKERLRTVQALYRHCLEQCNIQQVEKPFSQVLVLSLSTENKHVFKKAEEIHYLDDPRFDPIKKDLLESGYSLFAIELGGENRAIKAKKLFGMSLVSDIVDEVVSAGPENSQETDSWQKRFERLKPVLLARLGKDRPQNRSNDENFFRSIKLIGVENLKKSFRLKDTENTIFEEEPPACWSTDSDFTIYINVNREEKDIFSALAECLAQRFGQTYYEAFENLLLCETDEERIRKLRRTGVSEDEVKECERSLENESLEPIPEIGMPGDKREKPGSNQSEGIEPPNTPINRKILDPSQGKLITDREIEIPTEGFGDEAPVQKPNTISPKGDGIKQEDKDIIEKTAMKWAMLYERKNGRIPNDVSSFNKGYDIESKNPETGEMHYIEVKGATHRPEKREITINEWKKSIELGDKYYIYYILGLGEDKAELRIIKNPSNKIEPEEKNFYIKLSRDVVDHCFPIEKDNEEFGTGYGTFIKI